MELLFLGSSAGQLWPSVFCPCPQCRAAIAGISKGSGQLSTCSCLLVDRMFLFDLPPNCAVSAIRAGVTFSDVTDLFVTHSHQDHFDPGILAAAGRTQQRPLHLFCNRRVTELLPSYQQFNRFFDPISLGLQCHTLTPPQTVCVDERGFLLRALHADHDRTGNESPMIYQFERNGKKLLYACDTGWFPDETWAEVERWQYDAVVIECTFHSLRDCRRGHLSLESFTAVLERLKGSGAVTDETVVVAQHLAHKHGPDGTDWRATDRALSDLGALAAHDGLRVEL